MIRALFPAPVAVVVATEEMFSAELHPEEATAVANAVDKRRREFAAGRAAARAALAELGQPTVALPRDDRLVRWPAGFIGSISHTRGCCAAAVVRCKDLLSLGLDIEQIEALKPRTVDLICSPEEQRRFAALPDGIDWGKVTFSAKEAFYKCYYPIERTYLGFKDVELEIDAEGNSFLAAIVNPDKPALNGSRTLQGNLRMDGQYVYAGVVLEH